MDQRSSKRTALFWALTGRDRTTHPRIVKSIRFIVILQNDELDLPIDQD